MEKDILAEARDAFETVDEAEADNRAWALDDLRFARLGEQWPEAVRMQRQKEGRPCLTLNRLPSFIRQVTNDARQNKPAIKVHPADDKADIHTAKVVNGLIRNIEYTSNADVAYDTASDFAASMGFGYLRVGLKYACDDTFDLDAEINRVANPFSVYGDPYSTAADSSDWDTAFVTEMLKEDEFVAKYPRAEKHSFTQGEREQDERWFEDTSIRVAEFWKRTEVERKLLQLSDGRAIYEEDFLRVIPDVGLSQQQIAEASGVTVINERMTRGYKVKQVIMTAREILEDNDWQGKYIPIIPVYGEEINVEGRRIFKSLIRDAKDAQQMFNYWRTASTELVALAPKAPFIGPKGFAKTDIAKWSTANTQTHPFIEYDGTQPPQRQPFAGMPAGALQEAMNASDDMKSIMGLFDASLGAKSNETSGKAILARQKEGDVSTFHFADNVTRAIRHTGRILIDLIPKVYSTARVIRIMGEDGKPENVQINKAYVVQGMEQLHDLRTGKYDLTVTTGPSFSTRREEAAYQMTEVMRALPAAAPVIGPHLAKNLDWPGAEEIAQDLELLSPVTQIKHKMEMEKQGVPPPPDPEVVKAEKEMQLQQQKGQNDIMLSREKMKLQQEQAQLDAMIKISEHKADMEMMGQKHAMTMEHGKQQAMQKLGQTALDSVDSKEGAPEHPIMTLINAVVVSNQQNLVMMQRLEQIQTAAIATEAAPKEIIMQTSQGKQLKAMVRPVLQ